MNAILAELLAVGEQVLLSGWVVFVRVGAMVSVLPAFGEQSVPVRVRLAISIAFTMIVLPAVPGVERFGDISGWNVFLLSLPEALTGLFFGILLRFFVFVLQIAGAIAAQSTSLSQIFGGSAATDPQPAMGHVLVTAGLALAALLGIHVQFAAYILQSYQLVPIAVLMDPQSTLELGLSRVAQTFSLAFSLAAPFVIASLLYNVTLGAINRAMPQLMVSFVGAPAITAGGLLILMISAPFVLQIWIGLFSEFILMPNGV